MALESGVVSLFELMALVRQESDMVNSNFVNDFELVSYISNSYKELYDMIVGAYGEDYYASVPASFTTNNNQQLYPLPDGTLVFQDQDNNPITPPPFYKLLGLDYQLSPNNPQGFVTLRTFPFSDRNRFAIPNFASFWGFTNLRYRLQGNNLWLTPLPATGQVLRLWYVPRPVNLISTILGNTSTSTTITVTDDVTPQVGMNITGLGIPDRTTITAVGSGTITISQATLSTANNIALTMYLPSQTVDGVSGWEEYIIIDAAIKCKDKEESDVVVLAGRKADMKKRIEGIAANRDPGTAAKTADVSGDVWNTGWGGGYNGDGY